MITSQEPNVVRDSAAVVESPTRSGVRLEGSIPGRLALGAAIAWVVLLWVVIASAGPVDPEAPVRAFDVVLSTALWSSMIAAAFGLASRTRFGLAATAGGAALMLVGAVACFFGGHFGAGILQSGAGVGLGAVALGGLRAT